jgi:hypothetical protein
VPPKQAPLTPRITHTHRWKPTAGNPGGRSYEGTVTNRSGHRISGVGVYVCDYDPYGTLKVLDFTFGDYVVPAHGRSAWGDTTVDGVGDWSKPSLTTVRAYEDLGR